MDAWNYAGNEKAGLNGGAVESTRARGIAVRKRPTARCRYCHREQVAADMTKCDHCGTFVCDSCGGVRDNPSGHGQLCAVCHRAAVEWRARWHFRVDAGAINPLNM
jgi:hypothetical protein